MLFGMPSARRVSNILKRKSVTLSTRKPENIPKICFNLNTNPLNPFSGINEDEYEYLRPPS